MKKHDISMSIMQKLKKNKRNMLEICGAIFVVSYFCEKNLIPIVSSMS